MKKNILLLILIAVFLPIAVVSAADNAQVPIHQDDFAQYPVGTDYIAAGKYKMGVQEGAITIQNDGDGNYLLFDGSLLPDGYSGQTGYMVPSQINSAVTTIKFDYNIMGTGEGIHFYCGKTINIELDASPVGYSNNADGVTENYYPSYSVSTGVWHEITAIINLEKQNFELYVDDIRIIGNGKFRNASQTTVGKPCLYINNGSYRTKKFGLRNIKIYDSEVRPDFGSDYAESLSAFPEKKLSSLVEHSGNIAASLSSAYAVFEGCSVAYSSGKYEAVSDNPMNAPVLYDGVVFAPVDYVAKALGGACTDGIVSVGEKSYAFNEGEVSPFCEKAPVKVEAELYIPITSKLAEYFGSCAYTDERGLAVIGMREPPQEEIIKAVLFELRNRSSVFGSGIKSDVLFSSRNFHLNRPDVKGGYDSLDAAKRFMSTSNRWTYIENASDIQKFTELGSIVQGGLNARPVTVEKDKNNADVTFTVNGKKYLKYVAASIDFEGNVRLRPSDGLDGWGCTNNPVLFDDLLSKAKNGIDKGQYIWQFDDHALNSGYGCYCNYCLEGFTQWLINEKGYKTYKELADNYGAGGTSWKWTEVSYSLGQWMYENLGLGTKTETVYYDETICSEPIENFNYKTYLSETEGINNSTDASSYYTAKNRMGKAYYEFSAQKVREFHKKLRDAMEEYAQQKGLKIYMSHNTSNATNDIRGTAWLYDIMDASMSEINPKYTQPDGVFTLRLTEQAFGKPYISSLWVNQGKTSMQLWESAVPLMSATGQMTVIPWDSWVYNSTRYYCTVDELGKNYSFIREYPYLFDHYEAPEEIGYMVDMDSDGISNTYLRRLALALGKKGMASRFIAQRTDQLPNYSVDESDIDGLKALVNVNGVNLSEKESKLIADSGITVSQYTFNSEKATDLQAWESDYWTARIKGIPEKTFAVLRKNSLYEEAPTVVHAVSFESVIQKNVEVEINNKYLSSGDTYTVKVYAPGKNPYTMQAVRSLSGITTVTIDALDNWTVLEIYGDNNKSFARFDVSGMSGIGIGSRVSYDSAKGDEKDFTITTYGQGINVYTEGDEMSGQDEVGFVYKRIDTDDTEIVAQVEQVSGESGIMIRDDVYSNAASVVLSYSTDKGLRFGKRDETNFSYIFKEFNDFSKMPQYLKMRVENSLVTAFISENGADWVELGSYSIYFKPGVAGAFASSVDGTKAVCRVRNLDIIGTNHVLESEIASVNLFEGRNPSFNNTLLRDFSAGFDGIWDSSLEGSTTDKYQADGKTAPDGTKAKVSRVSGSADSSGASVKLTNRGNGDEGLWYRYLPVENGKTYEISCWAKVDPSVSETGFLHVQTPMVSTEYTTKEYIGTNTFEVLMNEQIQLSDEWKRVYVRFRISDDGYAQGIDVIFKTLGTADVYLDNFEMRELHFIGENIYASVADNGNGAVLNLSSVDGTTENVMYAAVVKNNENGTERVVSVDMNKLELTGATDITEITLDTIGSCVQVYLWDSETIAPLNRVFEVRKTK